MTIVEEISKVIESSPDGWVFAAVGEGQGAVFIPEMSDYTPTVNCIGMAILKIHQETDAGIDRIAEIAADQAEKNRDQPAVERIHDE